MQPGTTTTTATTAKAPAAAVSASPSATAHSVQQTKPIPQPPISAELTAHHEGKAPQSDINVATQQAQADVLRRTTDNTAGYDAGTGSRGGGSGGTTEAMTGGVAATGDERPAGIADVGEVAGRR